MLISGRFSQFHKSQPWEFEFPPLWGAIGNQALYSAVRSRIRGGRLRLWDSGHKSTKGESCFVCSWGSFTRTTIVSPVISVSSFEHNKVNYDDGDVGNNGVDNRRTGVDTGCTTWSNTVLLLEPTQPTHLSPIYLVLSSSLLSSSLLSSSLLSSSLLWSLLQSSFNLSTIYRKLLLSSYTAAVTYYMRHISHNPFQKVIVANQMQW